MGTPRGSTNSHGDLQGSSVMLGIFSGMSWRERFDAGFAEGPVLQSAVECSKRLLSVFQGRLSLLPPSPQSKESLRNRRHVFLEKQGIVPAGRTSMCVIPRP